MLVNAGKYWLREKIVGATDWEADPTKRYMAAGVSTNTNAGVVGPSGTTYITATGGWQGPSSNDWKLTTESTTESRPQVSFTVGVNGFIHVQCIYTDAHFLNGATNTYDLCEFGLYLNASGIGGNDPVAFPTAGNKEKAMIGRWVNFYKDNGTQEYKPFYWTKQPGVDCVVAFDIIDFGV